MSAADIWRNLHFPNGTAVIPNNSFVYISTDDPDGVCVGCLKDRKPCESYPLTGGEYRGINNCLYFKPIVYDII